MAKPKYLKQSNRIKGGSHRYHEFGGAGADPHGMPDNTHHDSHIGSVKGESHLCTAIDELHRQHPASDKDTDQGKRPSAGQHRPLPAPIMPAVAHPKGSGKGSATPHGVDLGKVKGV